MNNDATNSKKLHSQSDEFPPEAILAPDLENMSPISRRRFLALAGASAAVVATSCSDYRDKGEIISYNKKPNEITYGKANYYASTYRDGTPILIKTREGRPIAALGNPEHPITNGKITPFALTSILDLYDPERLKSPTKNGAEANWQGINEDVVKALGNAHSNNKKIAVICDNIDSPTAAYLMKEFAEKHSNAKVYSIKQFNDAERRNAWKECYGDAGFYPSIHWEKAKIIVALEADILGKDGKVIEQVMGFAANRDIDNPKEFNRLYAIESNMSLTGMHADYRVRLNPLLLQDLLIAIYNELIEKISPIGFNPISGATLDKVLTDAGLSRKVINTLINDLMNNQGKALLYAGDTMPKSVHILVNHINEVIGASSLYNFTRQNLQFFDYSSNKDIENLLAEMNNGQVEVAIVWDCNPAYTFAQDLKFSEAFAKVPNRIALSEMQNETTALCNYVLAINHCFESWGDSQIHSGIVNLRQPVIEPLYNTQQAEALLLYWAKPDNIFTFDIYHKYLKNYWTNEILIWLGSSSDMDTLWFSALHNGFVEIRGNQFAVGSINSSSLNKITPLAKPAGFTILLESSYATNDGRYAGNGWLQEIPHPVTKAVWDNYAAISPATAEKNGLDYKDYRADLIEVTIGTRKLELPVLLQPGLPDDFIAIQLGYGRENAGTIGSNIGFNGNLLLSKENNNNPFILTGASIAKSNKKYNLFSSQEHHKLENEFVKDFHRIRLIIQDGTVAEYLNNPNFIKEKKLLPDEKIEKYSVNPPHDYSDVKWAMAIDLNKCVSCSNCVAACNVENNVPIVGKEESGKGREMQWMRIDRYYSGTSEEPIVSTMPMLCQHCDMAPCENVCPVVATTHSPDGLNQMTYNRCVGTRYCANNCPYKVRRFNFFDFRTWYADGYYERDSLELLHNPEVTVRSRGVMEKCTFCIQRIMEDRQDATKNGEKFDGSKTKTACQEACPANAIVFGNINDPNSEIAKLAAHNLGYKVLEVMGIKPNVTYIAKLRNINEEDAV